jgi:outer membrane protein assembly factor BamB
MAEDKVILVVDQNLDSYIIAFNKQTGERVWKTARPEAQTGHSTPIVYKPKGGDTQILVPGSFLLTAYSAQSGDKLWWTGGLCFEMKSVPVITDKLLFINGYGSPLNQPENQVKLPSFQEALKKYDADKDGKLTQEELPQEPVYSWVDFVDLAKDGFIEAEDWSFFQAALASLNGMLAIRLGGKGDMTKHNIVWSYRRSVPQLPSPLLYKNVLYMINDGGHVTTFKPESGEVINEGRIRRSGSKFYASPVAADNKVYIVSLKGKITILKPDGSLDVLAQSDLKEDCYATPAIDNGRIYLRTVNTLYCFGSK